jgi:hypothetical protein
MDKVLRTIEWLNRGTQGVATDAQIEARMPGLSCAPRLLRSPIRTPSERNANVRSDVHGSRG